MNARPNYVRNIVKSMSHPSLDGRFSMSGLSLWTKVNYGPFIVTVQMVLADSLGEVCPVYRHEQNDRECRGKYARLIGVNGTTEGGKYVRSIGMNGTTDQALAGHAPRQSMSDQSVSRRGIRVVPGIAKYVRSIGSGRIGARLVVGRMGVESMSGLSVAEVPFWRNRSGLNSSVWRATWVSVVTPCHVQGAGRVTPSMNYVRSIVRRACYEL